MKRLPALDGLRGIAICLVLAHHLLYWPQGWMGVDLFFVLSGYLITTILLAERTEPHFWRIFYLRRATRILPAFALFLILSAFTGRVPWLELGPFVALTASDFAFLHHAGSMAHSGLGNLWSLSVEEHFYFVWPVLVRRLRRALLVAVLLAVVVLEPVARVLALREGLPWTVTYFTTPFRLDGLALGSLLALAMQHPRSRHLLDRVVPYALPVAVAGVLSLLPFLRENTFLLLQDAFGYTWLAVTAAFAVFYLVSRPEGRLSAALSWRPLVFFGRVSYGLYLYHVVIFLAMMDFAWAHSIPHTNGVRLLSLPVSVLVSWLSFRFLEAPILAWGRGVTRGFLEERAVTAQSGM